MGATRKIDVGRTANLGTFAGVFTPSILTILGLILFRRMGYVVGAAGVVQTLVILAIAHGISILTSASLSAIATNFKVKGGGDYYLISRSLGMEFGGAIGVVLFLAQAISVAFYCIGFGEAVQLLLPSDGLLDARLVAALAVAFLFLFAWLGADWATRMQYVVMAALVAGLLSFFIGGAAGFSAETLARNWSRGADGAPDFWLIFALFFPAVTGFTQGVSMSGDLKDPGRSLPAGTFAAVGVSAVVYVGAALLFAGNLPANELVADYEAMGRVAWLPALITVGIVAATLSSALASFMGAPRILQALAADGIFPVLKPFARGFGPSRNPRVGVVATLVIALIVVALGGVDVIAPVVTMFFLISYGLLNYATALEARANTPNFRPRFRWFHYRASLLGALACVVVMLMINPLAGGAALALLGALYHYVQRLARPERWADSRRAHEYHQVRTGLLNMSKEPVHPRNWRPNVLVFSDDAERRAALMRFAVWMEGGAGITTLVRLLEGSGAKLVEHCAEVQAEMDAEIEASQAAVFARAVAAPDLEAALQTVLQVHGLGPVRPNTILLNWLEHRPEEDTTLEEWNQRLFVRHLRLAARMGVNIVVLDADAHEMAAVEAVPAAERRIDVWWFDEPTGRLMLLLAYLVMRSPDWTGGAIRLLVRADRSTNDKVRARMVEALEDMRIDAEVVVETDLNRDKLQARSRDATLVLLPLGLKGLRLADPFGRPLDDLVDGLGAVALVSVAQDITLDADPEEGMADEEAPAETAEGRSIPEPEDP